VPVELAAVLGVLRSGKPGFFWHIPIAAQRRLDVGKGASPALQLWAGLRLVNETAIRFEQLSSVLRVPPDLSGPDYWAAVVRLEALGSKAFLELVQRAGGVTVVGQYVLDHELGDVAGQAEGLVIYRTLAVRTWVDAALELCRGRGTELQVTAGELIESRDARVRAIAKKASIGGWGLAHLLTLIRAKGMI
jgi:hypothetical protein